MTWIPPTNLPYSNQGVGSPTPPYSPYPPVPSYPPQPSYGGGGLPGQGNPTNYGSGIPGQVAPHPYVPGYMPPPPVGGSSSSSYTQLNPALLAQFQGLMNQQGPPVPAAPDFSQLLAGFNQMQQQNNAQMAPLLSQLTAAHPVNYNLPPEVLAMLQAQQVAANNQGNQAYDKARGQLSAELGSRGMNVSTLAEGDINSLARQQAEMQQQNAANFAGQELGQIGNFVGAQLQGQGLQQQGIGTAIGALGNQTNQALQGALGQGQLLGQSYGNQMQAYQAQQAAEQARLASLANLLGMTGTHISTEQQGLPYPPGAYAGNPTGNVGLNIVPGAGGLVPTVSNVPFGGPRPVALPPHPGVVNYPPAFPGWTQAAYWGLPYNFGGG